MFQHRAQQGIKQPPAHRSGLWAIPLLLLTIFLLVGLWCIQHLVLPHARVRDLDRATRYATFSRFLIESDAVAGVPLEATLAKIRETGLDNAEIIGLDRIPEGKSPRYIVPGSHVEAWEIFRGPDGRPAGAVYFRRWSDTTRWSLFIIQIIAAVLVLCGLLLIATSWLTMRAPLTKGIKRLSARLRGRAVLPDAGSQNVADPLVELEGLIEESFDKSRRAEESRQRLLDEHTEAACIGTTDGTLLEVNAAYARMFGRTPEQLAGTNYLDLIPAADRTEVVNGLQKLTPRNPTNVVTHRVVLGDGTIRWTRWRDRAAFDESGAVKEVLSLGLDVTEEQNLRDQLGRFRLAFDQMQSLARTGSLTWNLTEDRMEWTEETFRLLGLAQETTSPSLERLLESVAPDDRELLRRLFERARENGDPFECEFRALLPDGSARVLQSRAEVRADPKTKILDQLTCTVRDITALRDAEAATKRELRFREAIEQSMAAGIVVSDENGCNLLVNPAFCEMTGWDSSELVGATAPYPYWPEEEIPSIMKAFESALAGQTPAAGFELKFRRKNGERFDVLVKVAPLLDSNDHRLGWLGVVSDITSIQNTRRELERTYERLRIAQEVAGFGIWDWDPVKDTLHWDRQSFALFGYPDANEPQKVWRKVHSLEEQERLTYELKRLIAAGGASGQDRIRAQWPDGTTHDILSTYVILRDENGRAKRVLGINRDVTSELEEERELRDANERLAAALEGGQFGTFEHIFGLGDVNWSPANYEINGIDPSVTDPARLFEAWKRNAGSFFPKLLELMAAMPVSQHHLTYEFTAKPAGLEPRRIRSSVFIERNKRGHPVRLVGITRRLD